MKRLALATTAVLGTVALLVLLWRLQSAVLLLFASLCLSAAVRPLGEGLQRLGVPRSVGLAMTYLAIIGGGAVIAVTAAVWLAGDLQRATADLVSAYEHVAEQWPQGSWLQRVIARWFPPMEQLVSSWAQPETASWLKSALGTAFSVAETLLDGLIVLVLSIYWSVDRVHFERLWFTLLPLEVRSRVRDVWRDVEAELGAYLRSEALQAVLAGLLLAMGYALLGVRYPVLLATWGGLAWLLPWVGVGFALAGVAVVSIPTLLLEAGSSPVVTSALAATYTVAVLVALEILVEPRLFNRGRFSSLLMALIVLAMVQLWGVLGLLLGPPLALTLQIVGGHLTRLRMGQAPVEAVTPGPLETRLLTLQAIAAEQGGASPEVASLIDRLTELVGEVREAETAGPLTAPETTPC